MAIANSIRQCFLSGASPGTNVTMPGVAVAATAGNVTVQIPAPGYFNYGMLRIKSLTPATGTMQVNSITASDGTNQVQLDAGQRAAVTLPAESTFPYLITDLKATSLIINMVASAAATVDIEFSGV